MMKFPGNNHDTDTGEQVHSESLPKVTRTDTLTIFSVIMILVAVIVAGCILWNIVGIIEFVASKTGLSAWSVRSLGIVIGAICGIGGLIGAGIMLGDKQGIKEESNVIVESIAAVLIGLFTVVVGITVWAVSDVVNFVASETGLSVWLIYPVGIIAGSILPIFFIRDEIMKNNEAKYVTYGTGIAFAAIISAVIFFVIGLIVWTLSATGIPMSTIVWGTKWILIICLWILLVFCGNLIKTCLMNYLFPRNSESEKPAKQLFCTNCGCSVSNGTSHCPSCGAMPLGHKKYCRHCGTALNPEQVVCVKCNNPIKTDGMTGGESVFWLIVGVIGGVWLLYVGYGLFGIILLVAAIGYFLVELARMIKK